MEMSQFHGQGDLLFMTFTHPDLKTTFKFLADDKSYRYRKRTGTKALSTLDKTAFLVKIYKYWTNFQ